MNHNLESLETLKEGDTLCEFSDSSKSWVPLGIVERLSGGVCYFRYANSERQEAYMRKYDEMPTLLWRFNTDGKGIITYNTHFRKLR